MRDVSPQNMATSFEMHRPLVTLGLPVYNGKRYLAQALTSLLAQDYANLEILISDNNSDDATEAICQDFATRDMRIRFIRQSENIGAKKNFEFLVSEARGQYFAWCPHDDIHRPRFVSACVEALERDTSSVLCNGMVAFLDEDGRFRKDWGDLNFDTRGMTKAERMLRLVDHTDWVDMLGLIRLEALKQALPFEPVWGQDVVLSMKLLAQGDFLKVPEVLLDYRVRSRPKSVQDTIRDVFGSVTDTFQPYLDMLESMLRVALEALPSQDEKQTFFQDYLHILSSSLRQGPHPSWREVVAPECLPQRREEWAPLCMMRRLLPILDSTISLDAHLDAELGVILLGCPEDAKVIARIAGIAEALSQQYPNATLLLVGSRNALSNVPALGEARRFRLPSQWNREAIRTLINEISSRKIDLAIHPGVHRREVALDICLTRCGAFRTVGFYARRNNLPRSVVGRLLKRFRIGDMNGAFTHLLPPCPEGERARAIISALGSPGTSVL
jgi:hypothetical protein